MFTGVVEEAGTVSRVVEDEGGRRLGIRTSLGPFEHGQSVSVSGACLTVEDSGEAGPDGAGEESPGADGWFEVFLAVETRDRTYLGDLEPGDPVNLERAMPADGRFDGHVVQGHVDATTEITAIEPVGEDWTFEFALPRGYERYVAPKGFVGLDGMSLTVAELDEAAGTFSVAIVPTTYEVTNLRAKSVGDPVNVEVDVLAKYVERLLADR